MLRMTIYLKGCLSGVLRRAGRSCPSFGCSLGRLRTSNSTRSRKAAIDFHHAVNFQPASAWAQTTRGYPIAQVYIVQLEVLCVFRGMWPEIPSLEDRSRMHQSRPCRFGGRRQRLRGLSWRHPCVRFIC